MNKQYRAEIKVLKAAARKVNRDFDAEIRSNVKAITLHERAIARLVRRDGVLGGGQRKATEKFARRIAILEGRLS
jgi:hypothetical protein